LYIITVPAKCQYQKEKKSLYSVNLSDGRTETIPNLFVFDMKNSLK